MKCKKKYCICKGSVRKFTIKEGEKQIFNKKLFLCNQHAEEAEKEFLDFVEEEIKNKEFSYNEKQI